MFFKLYFLALPVFVVVDAIWLGLVARGFYKEQLGSLMKTNINWTAAVIFYLLFIAGLVLFVIEPGVEKNSFTRLVAYAALFGLVTYATYDLTNLATIKGWPLNITIIDLIWGASLSVIVSSAVYYLNQNI
jgi:uncharacterized membrane protein